MTAAGCRRIFGDVAVQERPDLVDKPTHINWQRQSARSNADGLAVYPGFNRLPHPPRMSQLIVGHPLATLLPVYTA